MPQMIVVQTFRQHPDTGVLRGLEGELTAILTRKPGLLVVLAMKRLLCLHLCLLCSCTTPPRPTKPISTFKSLTHCFKLSEAITFKTVTGISGRMSSQRSLHP